MISSISHWILITIYFFAATLTIPLLSQVIRKHNSPGSYPLSLLLLSLGIWSFTVAMQLAVPLEPTKIHFLKLSGIGISLGAFSWLAFAIEYTQLRIPYKLKVYTTLGIIVLLHVLFMSTNELHTLYWTDVSMVPAGDAFLLIAEPGLLFFAFIAYQISLTVVGISIMFYYSVKRGTTYQAHARLLGLGISFILASSFVTYTGSGPVDGLLNVIPLGILVAELALIVSIYRFNLMSLAPAKRDQLLYEQEGIQEAEALIQSQNLDLPLHNIGELARSVRSDFYEHQDFDSDSVSISVDCDITTPANEDLIERLFYALYENAAVHNIHPVDIHVSELAFEDGFAVEDNGKGIPDTYKDSVFDTGINFDSTGSGNGLAVIDRIAKAHKWNINLTDSADGGCRFEFTNVSQESTSDSQ